MRILDNPLIVSDIIRDALREAHALGRTPSPKARFVPVNAVSALILALNRAGFEIVEKSEAVDVRTVKGVTVTWDEVDDAPVTLTLPDGERVSGPDVVELAAHLSAGAEADDDRRDADGIHQGHTRGWDAAPAGGWTLVGDVIPGNVSIVPDEDPASRYEHNVKVSAKAVLVSDDGNDRREITAQTSWLCMESAVEAATGKALALAMKQARGAAAAFIAATAPAAQTNAGDAA